MSGTQKDGDAGRRSAGHALAPLSEDSEQRMSCSDPELAYAKCGTLSNSEVERALQTVAELFPASERGAHAHAAGEEDELSATPTETRSRSCSVGAHKDPLSRHIALVYIHTHTHPPTHTHTHTNRPAKNPP